MSKHVNRGLAWIGAASSLVGVLDIVAILIILNNWVSTADYGIATKCIWIFPILDQATDLGLSAALIQRDDHDDAKISTVFWLNLITGALLFLAIVALAPVASAFYEHAIVGSMLIAFGTKLIWQNVYLIPMAMMKRELRFKELSLIRIVANLAEFAGKLGFAAAGFGIWCFVLGPLARVLVTAVGVQLRYPWRPRMILRIREARDYVLFGIKTSGSQMLFQIYTNLDYPVVGYYFGDHQLGLYRLAYEVVLEPVRIISAVIVDIAFPAFARLRHHPKKLVKQLVSFTRLNIITVMLYSSVVFVAADDVLALVFPDYRAAAPAVRILCAVALLRAISFVVPPLLDGIGLPHRTFIYSLIATLTLPLAFIVGAVVLGDDLQYLSVAVAWAVGYPIAFSALIWMATTSLQWSVLAYLRAIAGVMACMIAGALAGLGVHVLLAGELAVLRLGVTAAVSVLVAGVLLAYTQGISPRSALQSLKGSTPPPG
ncbi:MAG TPA: oligosaccharide flippase family protein [Kofleriaceae bacterium]|nr:oligosaccharide flippase family protein [Kofleriaceae bacterium]